MKSFDKLIMRLTKLQRGKTILIMLGSFFQYEYISFLTVGFGMNNAIEQKDSCEKMSAKSIKKTKLQVSNIYVDFGIQLFPPECKSNIFK